MSELPYIIIETKNESEWLEQRRKVLTATEIGRIVAGSTEIRRIKQEKENPTKKIISKHFSWGKHREDSIGVYAKLFIDSQLVPNKHLHVSTLDPRIGATPDMVAGQPIQVLAEIKTSSKPLPDMSNPEKLKGLDLRYYTQMQVQMAVTGAQKCYLVWERHDDVWMPNPDWVNEDDPWTVPAPVGIEFVEVAFNKEFWDGKIIPALDRYFTYEVDDSAMGKAVILLEDLHAIQKEAALLATRERELKTQLAELIKPGDSLDAEFATVAHISGTTRTSLDSAALKKAHPKLYEEFSKTTEAKPQLRVKFRDEKDKK